MDGAGSRTIRVRIPIPRRRNRRAAGRRRVVRAGRGRRGRYDAHLLRHGSHLGTDVLLALGTGGVTRSAYAITGPAMVIAYQAGDIRTVVSVRSTDAGVTWQDAFDYQDPTHKVHAVRVAGSDSGSVVVVKWWRHSGRSGVYDDQAYVKTSTDYGSTWGPVTNVSDPLGGANAHGNAAALGDTAIAIWGYNPGPGGRIEPYYSWYTEDSGVWDGPTRIPTGFRLDVPKGAMTERAVYVVGYSTTVGPDVFLHKGTRPEPPQSPPVVTCPDAIVEEATSTDGVDVAITIQVSDPDGDSLTVTWETDGEGVGVDVVDAAEPRSVRRSIPLSLGSHVVMVSVSDGASDAVSCEVVVEVRDTTAPVVAASFVPSTNVADAPKGRSEVPAGKGATSNPDGFYLVMFSATDAADTAPSLTGSVGGFAVGSGEKIKYTIARGRTSAKLVLIGKARIKHIISADTPELIVTAVDASGNVAVEVVTPSRDDVAASARFLATRVAAPRMGVNYPNPFNPETWIPYQLSDSAPVTITIYDMAGAVIRRLDLGQQAAGVYASRGRAAYWDGRDQQGETAASGVYVVQLRAGAYRESRRMLLRK